MRCKMINLVLGLILVGLLSVPGTIQAAVGNGGFIHCETTVKNWAFLSIDSEVKDDKHVLRDLLFFLHVPRTGGRTYYHCFLRKMYAASQECPRSYDKLRLDPRKPKCRLLSTHDDYSMMSKLPKEETSVVTILRNPVDRVFSTYEFSVEVAARFLIHPNLTSVARMSQRMRRKKVTGVSTLDIWPWKYLVPWMREDLFARRDARKLRGQNHFGTNNPYDMEDILIPLHDYINDPIAQDVIHNGATFQITGLTNNSFSAQAHEVRHCVLKYPTLGEYVLKVAKRRLDKMLYVGLTENHKESATMFGNIVASQVISQHTSTSENDATPNDSEQSSVPNTISGVNGQALQNESSAETDDALRGNLTVGKLMETYESCISSLRSTQAQRRVNSLKRISPANFTKETRHQVPEELIQEIKSLNSLDVELYEYAQHIFKRQRAHVMQNMIYDGSVIPTFSTDSYPSFYDSPFLKLFSVVGLPLLLIVFYIVYAKVRKSSKLKL